MKNSEDDPAPEPRDEVAMLIRLAGRRPAVPDDVAARVRAAAHEQWQSGLRRRARARFLWTTAGLAAVASVILAIAWSVVRVNPAGPPVPQVSVRVESLAGSAWAGDRPLQAGAGLPVGAEVETGEGGRVAVRLASGHSVRLDADSRIQILGRATLAVSRGAVYVDSGAHTPKAEPLRLQTPLGEVRETGTQFEVRLGADSIRIRVREGSVILRAADGRHEVGVLTELETDGHGISRTREIPRSGPEWSWIAGIAPMPDIEGLSARVFLDRMAREGGWTLHFADEDVAGLADETVLQGSVEGLTVDQALEAVLPTCGMVHRIEDGRLIVDRVAI
ncbi:MAG TPA: FecR family protein [Thermoanaerobaculia bacterium]|nr:FecR family protein [Thermoanaerobaculia bacterium]